MTAAEFVLQRERSVFRMNSSAVYTVIDKGWEITLSTAEIIP